MDLTCFNWVQLIKKTDLPPNAKLLAFYLSTFMNAEQDIAWPSQSLISTETGLSKITVRKYLQILEAGEWLIIRKKAHHVDTGNQSYLHNEYLINIPEQRVRSLLSGMSRGKTEREQRVNSERPEGKELTPNNNRITSNNNNGVPYSEIVNLYHEKLPELPKVVKLTAKRKSQIKQRWKNDLETMEQWENFFSHVSKSDFLMGRKPPTNGRPQFRADIEWLTNETNLTKIAEGKYHV